MARFESVELRVGNLHSSDQHAAVEMVDEVCGDGPRPPARQGPVLAVPDNDQISADFLRDGANLRSGIAHRKPRVGLESYIPQPPFTFGEDVFIDLALLAHDSGINTFGKDNPGGNLHNRQETDLGLAKPRQACTLAQCQTTFYGPVIGEEDASIHG